MLEYVFVIDAEAPREASFSGTALPRAEGADFSPGAVPADVVPSPSVPPGTEGAGPGGGDG
jgi:hypothetical protein